MAVKIGSARIDERGKATGGQAGDQKGGAEVSTQSWYKHTKGWRVVRAKDPAVRKKLAYAMQAACDNNLIGYDQGQRDTLYSHVKTKGFDPAKVTKAVETDCSALVRVCVNYASVTLGNIRTNNEVSALLATGAFVELTGSKYTDKSDYLMAGDILCTKTQGHTVIVLTDGPKAEYETPQLPKASVRITGGSVNVRAAAGTAAKIVKVVHKSEVYVFTGTAMVGTTRWYHIPAGWVSGKYVVEV